MAGLSRFLFLAAVATQPFGAARAAGDPLAVYRGTHRVVVALAPSPADPALAEQRRMFDRLGAEGRARDLVLVVATDGTPEGVALRRRFGGGGGFRAVLVGKDGAEKLGSGVPLGRDTLFPLIDAMPMRREEMSREP